VELSRRVPAFFVARMTMKIRCSSRDSVGLLASISSQIGGQDCRHRNNCKTDYSKIHRERIADNR
jgi:hypothetical protein